MADPLRKPPVLLLWNVRVMYGKWWPEFVLRNESLLLHLKQKLGQDEALSSVATFRYVKVHFTAYPGAGQSKTLSTNPASYISFIPTHQT